MLRECLPNSPFLLLQLHASVLSDVARWKSVAIELVDIFEALVGLVPKVDAFFTLALADFREAYWLSNW